jgi:hypothetical protein
MTVFSRFALASVLALAACQGSGEQGTPAARSGLEAAPAVASLGELDELPFAGPEELVRAAWGRGDGEVSREDVAARTGPMAIAAEPGAGGGVNVLDTVGGRVLRFDGRGALRATVPVGVETGDDLAALPDGSLAVLAYHRLPAPGTEVLTFSADGAPRVVREAPQAATMPTALLVDDAAGHGTLGVENRHADVLPLDGSPRLWGRPAGDLLLRAEVFPGSEAGGGLVQVTARDRAGQLAWERDLEVPWAVVEVLGLEGCDRYVAIVLRGVEPEFHETYVVALDSAEGVPLGRLRLRDARITDAGRPVALGRGGDVFELATDEGGASVLRYRWEEGAR